jgi:hypothetical protein
VEFAPPNYQGFRKRIASHFGTDGSIAPEATAVGPTKRREFVRAVESTATGHAIEFRT